MALIWADNFEMYGVDADMLNGIYAQVDGPTLGGVGENRYLYVPIGYSGGGAYQKVRFVLPSPRSVFRNGGFLFMEQLPRAVDEVPFPFVWKNAGNSFLFSVAILPTGQIAVKQGDYSGTILATTSTPVVTANASIHLEAKLKVHATEGSIEVRVRGRTVILLENIDTGTSAVAQVEVANRANFVGSGVNYRWQHYTIWDDLGAVNNDFLGQVMVYWGKTITDISDGGWVSSADAPVDETLNKPLWANQLTSSGNIVNSDTVRINNTYYRWTSSAPTTGAGTSASPWLVALGADSAESLKNMYEAVNASGIPGTTYS